MITLATDWALRRSAHQTVLFLRLINDLQYVLMMQKFDSRERIVNRDGIIISRWK